MKIQLLRFAIVASSLFAGCASGNNKNSIATGSISINDDAMTMHGCKERLALPKSKRPQDSDRRVDLDAVCRNMLDSTSVAPGTAHAASATTR